ncbi:MAG: gamma-glutamyltransferase [Alphaproteobacteria bacterium]|nr:gamma-glutamyltransferase [Alphaproteobacteria bacterium]
MPSRSNALPEKTHRPAVRGRHWAVSTNHWLASLAASRILDSGGNAVDAGVAAGMALGVLQPDIVGCTGVAPMIIYLAETDEVVTISGLGRWPRAASADYFTQHHGGDLPLGVLRCVTPAAIDAWCQALQRYGTKTFGEVAQAAFDLASGGFATHRLLAETVAADEELYASWGSSAGVFLANSRAPHVGEPFNQDDLGRSFGRLIEAEARSTGGREAGIEAVRDEFHQGGIARDIMAHFEAEGGLMTADDLNEFRSGHERPERVQFGDWEVFSCGPWCQGPALLEAAQLFAHHEFGEVPVNSKSYVHEFAEVMKLSFADREAYFGDPEFVDVPLDDLLSDAFAGERVKAIDRDRACPDLPRAGETRLGCPDTPWVWESIESKQRNRTHQDTTYLCVVDKDGNGFSATPSDGYNTAGIIPALGFAVSTRGDQNWIDRRHPSVIEPWKRPRLTPNPALAKKNGKLAFLFGTPGGDVQIQAMLQVFVNHAVHGMDPQAAIEAPRFASESFPGSFWPHTHKPGVLRLEPGLMQHAEALEAKGHVIEPWPELGWRAGGVCAIAIDDTTGDRIAGADPRRECTALAW